MINNHATHLRIYNEIRNYIYLYHTKTYLVLPVDPDSMSESLSVNWSSNAPLGSSAPLQSFSNTQGRSLQFVFKLHREWMKQCNYGNSSVYLDAGDDYMDVLIKQIQSAAYAVYGASEKMVDPPQVAVRLGNEVYVKGVVNNVGVTYDMPLLRNDKYAMCTISFSVTETVPWDATEIAKIGSFRMAGEVPISTSLDRGTLYTSIDSSVSKGAGGGGKKALLTKIMT